MCNVRLTRTMRTFLCIMVSVLVLSLVISAYTYAYVSTVSNTSRQAQRLSPHSSPPAPGDIRLDERLPIQTVAAQGNFTNINAKFGSRFNFSVSPGASSVSSGTDGVFHDNKASYIVGLAPSGQQKTFLFHMGTPNSAQGDAYVRNELWTQGLNTTRWEGDASDNEGMHIVVDFIDTFRGEPGCTAIASCAGAVKDDTVPVLIIGISLQNFSPNTLTGNFLFGSNRKLPPDNACMRQTTPGGTAANVFSYDSSSDATGGTLFLAGDRQHWACNMSGSDRAGLSWAYSVPSRHTNTGYLLLGGWNGNQKLFANTTLPAGCQNEGLYASHEWSSEQDVVNFALDNLSTHDNLLAQAQGMENYLIHNNAMTPAQRWLIGDTLRSYKASSWLIARQDCAGGGYDAAVYEGTYGFLTTVDVMHEYGYFEITRVPWFFKNAMSMVFKNATSNAFGTYFQHDQGGDIDGKGNCTSPGQGIPTFRSTCYIPPYVSIGIPMPTEENDDVALLMAYYGFVTGDTAFIQQSIGQIDAAMNHNIKVGDPNTGIAYKFQDTNTTYDAASDCLHSNMAGAGNQYYLGLKEATGYRAAAYLDGMVSGNPNATTWNNAATRIENAMLQEYSSHGFLPIANSTAFTNCNGRSVALGEGLFYLHLIGLDSSMNQVLLQDLAQQYPADLSADTLSSPAMIVMTSTAATGAQCSAGHCHRYEWFSKVMLSGIVADLVYTQHGCNSCKGLDEAEAAYSYNFAFSNGFGDGFHDDSSDWGGHLYPRGIISWAYLSAMY